MQPPYRDHAIEEPGGNPARERYDATMPDRRATPTPKEDDPWKPVRHWQKSFEHDTEYYAVFQSRRDPLLFLVTRSFVAGGFEQDYKKKHRAVDHNEAQAILRNPESFYGRMRPV
jgi:hypothetical protein